jgi:hypothetical protein
MQDILAIEQEEWVWIWLRRRRRLLLEGSVGLLQMGQVVVEGCVAGEPSGHGLPVALAGLGLAQLTAEAGNLAAQADDFTPQQRLDVRPVHLWEAKRVSE